VEIVKYLELPGKIYATIANNAVCSR